MSTPTSIPTSRVWPVVLVGALLVVGLVLATLFYYRSHEARALKDAQESLVSIASLKTDQISNWIKTRKGDAGLFLGNPFFSDLVKDFLKNPQDAEAQKRFHVWLQAVQTNHSDYDRVFFLDMIGNLSLQGTEVAQPQPSLRKDSPLRQAATEALRSGQISFLDLHKDQTHSDIRFAFVVPIFDIAAGDNPPALGCVVLQVDPNKYLYPLVRRWPTPSPSSETLLVRRDGDDMLFLNDLKFYANAALNFRLPLEGSDVPASHGMRGEFGLFTNLKDYRGVDVLADVRPVPGTPWLMVTRLDKAEAYAQLWTDAWTALYTLVSALVVVGLAIGWVYYWQRAQIRIQQIRLESEEEIRKSEILFRSVFENAGFGLTIRDPNGHFLRVNPFWLKMLGYSEDELKKLSVRDVTFAEDLPLSEDAMQRLLVGLSQCEELEKRYVKKDGQTIWCHTTMTRICDEHNAPFQFVTQAHDITERKQAEEALKRIAEELRKNRELLNSVIEGTTDAVFVKDLEGRYLLANSAVSRIVGKKPEEILGKDDSFLFPPDEANEVVAGDRAVMARGKVVTYEDIVTSATGKLTTFLATKGPLFDAQGKIVGLFGISRDITELKESVAALKRIEWMLAKKPSLLAAAEPDYRDLTLLNKGGLIATSIDRNTLRDIVSEYVDLLGTSAAIYEKNGDHAVGVFTPPWCQMLDEASRKLCPTDDNAVALASGKWLCHESCWACCSKQTITMRTPIDIECNGGIRICSAPIFMGDEVIGAINFGYGDPPKDHDKLVELSTLYGVSYDILKQEANAWESRPQFIIEMAKRRLEVSARFIGSLVARKQVEDALKDAARRKDDFLAMLGHELRNPLASIRNAAQILKMVGMLNSSAEKAREMVERQTNHLSHIVDDLLDVSRVSRGKVALHLERLDLTRLVRECVEDFRLEVETRGMTLNLEIPSESLWVKGDVTRLTQVLSNLLVNAQKFSDSGGTITVKLLANPRTQQAELSVRDTGMGISASVMTHLFEPFVQAEVDLARRRGGLGLGLALAKGLVEMHNGTIRAESEGPRKGTLMTVSIPLIVERVATTGSGADLSEAELEVAKHVRRVLVIEDNFDAAESLQLLLGLFGHTVETAFDGASGMRKVHSFAPDVILCDIGLPGGMDGYEIARTIRQDPKLRDIYLIAMTGYGQDEDKRQAHDAGFNDHVTKPADPVVLERMLLSVPVTNG